MSGGVDSAVALLRSGPKAIGVTLRLWLDPDGPDAERACCSPEAVLAARRDLPRARPSPRDARPPRRVPPRRRRAVRARLRARRDAQPVHRLQRRLPLRRAARLCEARRRGGARDRALRPDRRASGPPAAGPRGRPRQGPDVHARPRSTRASSSESASRSADSPRTTPAQRRPPPASTPCDAARARRPASSPATTTARSSSGTGSRRAPARSSTRTARGSASTRASGATHRASAAGSASPRPSRSTPSAPSPARTRVVVGPRRLARADERQRAAAASTPTPPRRREAPLPLARGGGDGRARRRRGFRLKLAEPAYGVAQGQTAVLYEGDAVVGSGVVTSTAAARLRCSQVLVAAFSPATSPTPARRLPAGGRPRPRLRVLPSGRNLRSASPRSSEERSASCCP